MSFPGLQKSNRYIILTFVYVIKWVETKAVEVAGAADVPKFFIDHPQANKQFERINHTLFAMFSMYVSKNITDWDQPLPYVTFAYSTSRKETTGRTPFFLMHGREMSSWDWIPMLTKSNSSSVMEKLAHTSQEVEEKVRAVKIKQKERYDGITVRRTFIARMTWCWFTS